MQKQQSAGAVTRTIEVVVHVKEVRDATCNVINEGDVVKETKTNAVLGKITNVKAYPLKALLKLLTDA